MYLLAALDDLGGAKTGYTKMREKGGGRGIGRVGKREVGGDLLKTYNGMEFSRHN